MPDYQCYAYTHPVYGPAMRLISSITNAYPAQVTTTFAHGYVDGTIVRFDLPPATGMQQLNQMTSPILVTGLTTFTIDVNTIPFAPFSVPVGLGPFIDVCPQVVPIGSFSDTLKPAVRNQFDPGII
jgi:hypothetical protein